MKLIQRQDGRTELYDLESDPDELIDLALLRPDLVEELSREVAARRRTLDPDERSRLAPAVLDDEERARMRALGYVD